MSRHAYAVIGLSAVILVAALISPGHAVTLAIGLALGPWLSRYLAQEKLIGDNRAARADADQRSGSPDSILDAIALPVIVLDSRVNVLLANPAARAAFPPLVAGKPLSFALRDPVVLGAVNDVIGDGKLRAVDLVEHAPVERSFVSVVSPVRDAVRRGGEPVAVLVLRETSQERAVEAMRVDFVANASHELRTPLASVLGFIETLQGPARNDAPAREKFLAIMHTQARRMARLVDDLLSLSRIELKEHIAPTETVDMGAIVDDNALALSELARERGVEIRIERATADTRVIGDRDELASVLENLIENAIKYGKSGKFVDVKLADGASDGELVVSVRDFGPGIAPQFLPRLTERFYRVDSTASRAEGGTGLGLALVKHTVNRHRGRLAIQSKPGEGALFTITLPRPSVNAGMDLS